MSTNNGDRYNQNRRGGDSYGDSGRHNDIENRGRGRVPNRAAAQERGGRPADPMLTARERGGRPADPMLAADGFNGRAPAGGPERRPVPNSVAGGRVPSSSRPRARYQDGPRERYGEDAQARGAYDGDGGADIYGGVRRGSGRDEGRGPRRAGAGRRSVASGGYGGGRRGGNGGGGAGGRRGGNGGGGRRVSTTSVLNTLLIILSAGIVITAVVMWRMTTGTLAKSPASTAEITTRADGEDVGGMTYNELIDYMNTEFVGDLAVKKISVRVDDFTEEFSFAELGASYDVEEAARRAFAAAEPDAPDDTADPNREITGVTREALAGFLDCAYDAQKVDAVVDRIAADAGVLTEDAEVRYTSESVIIKPGVEGSRIDRADLIDRIGEALGRFESAVVESALITSRPDNLDADKIYETIHKEPVDATYKVSEDHKSVVITDSEPGQSVDRDRLARAINSLNDSSQSEVTIPLVTLEPKVDKADLGETMFQDVLGTASTKFSTSGTNNKNRRDNMVLATAEITGYILAPGDEFAFNEAVGQRTTEKGYKKAGAFIEGQLIDDVGGGICQVSSTLYNAVLYADLNVTVRQNHSSTVGYVPLGLDATVSFPQPDFKFANSLENPVRINCGVDGGTISFTIHGTRVGPEKKIRLWSEQRGTTQFNTVQTEDPTLPLGEIKVTQAGKVGYTYDSYKAVQIGDAPEVTTKIATNRYRTMDQLEQIGTGPPRPEETPTVTPGVTPAPGEDGQTPEPSDGGVLTDPDETTRPTRTPRIRNTPRPDDGDEPNRRPSDEPTSREPATETTGRRDGGTGDDPAATSATSPEASSADGGGTDTDGGDGETTTSASGEATSPRATRTPRPR